VQRQHLLDRRPPGHPLQMAVHLGKPRGIDAVGFQPARHGEEIGIGDGEPRAHRPGPFQHLALDRLEAGRHVCRTLRFMSSNEDCFDGG
jgi:hypothetical protein